MIRTRILFAAAVSVMIAGARVTVAADTPAATPKSAAMYAAAGPTGEADLMRLKAALEKLPGIERVDVRPTPFGAALRVRGEPTVSQLAAAARAVGYELRPSPVRTFRAEHGAGALSDDELQKLRTALSAVEGIDRIELNRVPSEANEKRIVAVRVSGIATVADLSRAGREVGFTLRQLAAYAAAGPNAPVDLARLQSALGRVGGVEQVEKNVLPGGAILLVSGDPAPRALTAAAKEAGYALWPLGEASRSSGGLVSLPSLTPEAGRNTPPDFDERVLTEQAQVGQPAPDFTLIQSDGQSRLHLADRVGKRPVVLLFGSCT